MEAVHNHRVGFGTAGLGDQAVEVSKKEGSCFDINSCAFFPLRSHIFVIAYCYFYSQLQWHWNQAFDPLTQPKQTFGTINPCWDRHLHRTLKKNKKHQKKTHVTLNI